MAGNINVIYTLYAYLWCDTICPNSKFFFSRGVNKKMLDSIRILWSMTTRFLYYKFVHNTCKRIKDKLLVHLTYYFLIK